MHIRLFLYITTAVHIINIYIKTNLPTWGNTKIKHQDLMYSVFQMKGPRYLRAITVRSFLVFLWVMLRSELVCSWAMLTDSAKRASRETFILFFFYSYTQHINLFIIWQNSNFYRSIRYFYNKLVNKLHFRGVF